MLQWQHMLVAKALLQGKTYARLSTTRHEHGRASWIELPVGVVSRSMFNLVLMRLITYDSGVRLACEIAKGEHVNNDIELLSVPIWN